MTRAGSLASCKRILIVDDNEDAADLMSTLMSSLGHEVCTVYSGHDCLDVATEFQPDIVFLDLGMPEISGYTVAERLRQNPRLKDVCLAAVTGWDDELTQQRVKNAGFNFHISKPAHIESLLHVVEFSYMVEINWFEALRPD